MRCKCGNEISHVPEHLQDLAKWVCRQCAMKDLSGTNSGVVTERNSDINRQKQPVENKI
ncbi:MAG: hypothetical protein SNJ70_09215 [Armatimonadota bacterium]